MGELLDLGCDWDDSEAVCEARVDGEHWSTIGCDVRFVEVMGAMKVHIKVSSEPFEIRVTEADPTEIARK